MNRLIPTNREDKDAGEKPQLTSSFLSEFPKSEAFIPALLFALAATFISVLCWSDPNVKRALVGNPHQVFEMGEWYRLLSSIFVHSNPKHLLGNMFFFIPFGGLLTYYFSWRMFPLAALVLGLVSQFIALKTYPPHISLQGASGVLYVMFGLWLSLYYKAESHVSSGKRWLRIIGFCLVMMVPSEFSPQVSYRSHLFGLVVGLIAGIIYGFIAHENFERRNHKYAMQINSNLK